VKSGFEPYTEDERQRDAQSARETQRVAYLRRRAAPSQDYDNRPTQALRRLWERMLGEVEPTA
jgi:hypothetical protein